MHVQIVFRAVSKTVISELLFVGDSDSNISVAQVSPPCCTIKNPTRVNRKNVINVGESSVAPYIIRNMISG